jgi:glycerol-3-phosphate acyltransferase PlsY
VFAILTPAAVAPVLAVFISTIWITKYVSLGSVLASLALPPIAYATGSSVPVVIAACAACVLIVFRHRSNVVRLRTGTERRLGARA